MKAVFTQYYKIESRERYASHGLHDRVIWQGDNWPLLVIQWK
jgi:hypothetical protein